MEFIDKEGTSIDLWTFERLFNDYKYRLIKAHRTREGIIIRTEWMGTDPKGDTPPSIYRTLIQHGPLDGTAIWSQTQEEALVQHEKYLQLVREGHWLTWRGFAAVVLLVTFVALFMAILVAIP